MGSKFLFGFLFNRTFRIYATFATLTLTHEFNSFFIKYLTIFFGTVFGLLVSTQLPTIRYLLSTCLIGIVFSATFGAVALALDSPRPAAFLYLLMYLLFGVSIFLSDFAILEVSNIRRHALYLSIGVVLEKLPIVISTYVGDHSNITLLYVYTGQLALMGILVAIMAKKYPDTLGRTQVQVQYLVLYGLDLRPVKPQISKEDMKRIKEEVDLEMKSLSKIKSSATNVQK